MGMGGMGMGMGGMGMGGMGMGMGGMGMPQMGMMGGMGFAQSSMTSSSVTYVNGVPTQMAMTQSYTPPTMYPPG